MKMEESREGIDWSADGGEVPAWLLAILGLTFGVPVALLTALFVVLAVAR